jgi:hypothetical protein
VTGWRRKLEQQAGPVVVLVSRMPRFVPFLVVAVLLVAGLVLKGVVGAVLLLVLAALLGVLLALSWPALQPGPRALRLFVVALVVLRAVLFTLSK